MSARGAVALSWIFVRRDWRAGELRLLLAGLIVAVGAIASVGLFVDRMGAALNQQARQLIGADLIVASDAPVGAALRERARDSGLQIGDTVTFPSMVLAGERAQLAAIKAVSGNYPLRGVVNVADAPDRQDAPANGSVPRGRAWLDPQLLAPLSVAVGDHVKVGDLDLTVDKLITLEPDRGTGFVNLAPRLMIALEDLPATGLIQPASRVSYRVLLSGAPAAVAAMGAWLRDGNLARGERVESLENGRPELRNTLDRAQRFLALVSMLTALIGAVAIMLAARTFAARHLDACAVLRAIGLGQRRLAAALIIELLWLGLVGGLGGLLVGWAVHLLLVTAMAPVIGIALPSPSIWPLVQALAAGLVLLLGFGAWPFLRLASVSPLRVLRRDLGAAPGRAWIALAIALAAFAALLTWAAGDRKLAAIALGGFAGGAAIFALLTWLIVGAVGPLRRAMGQRGGIALRLALASWSRRRAATVAQTVAVAIGLMALALLTATRTDLIDSWHKSTPADAPNRFMINIQPDQRDVVQERLRQAGVTTAQLSPMVRGRLVTVNGKPVDGDSFQDDRAKRLVEREFNLSYGEQQPAHNQTVEGRWISPKAAEVSGETGIMKTLGLKVGDELAFDVAGEVFDVKLVGGRKVEWDSMQVNFFMIMSPMVLADKPQTYITAYHWPPLASEAAVGSDGVGNAHAAAVPAVSASAQPADLALVHEYPNLTVFDLSHILKQVQGLLDQVIQAVEFLFALTLLAGLIVLYAALAGSRDERVREAAVLRALGGSRRQLLGAQLWELGIAGGVAGLLASLGALAIGWALASQVFQFDYQPRPSMILVGTLAGALVALITGWLGLRGVLSSPPIATLRDG